MNDHTAEHPLPPGEEPAAYHRSMRNYLLDARMQLRFATYLGVVAAALSAFFGWRLWLSYREASRLVALGDPLADQSIAQMLASEDRVRMIWLGAGLAALLICLLVFTVVVTHKVAGPALVVGRTCRQVGEGTLRRPRKLRQGDLLTGLAEDAGNMVDRLREREEGERAALLDAAAQMAYGPEGVERAREIVERIAAEKAARLAK
ncbi:MAG TPA: hypothetical protein VLD85_06775 [Anaeromyxobacteraceae bacterium]|nr:hypothetical protein [Anaeromyxobacteraceae bacterium]